ncbi:hypothetical protein B0J13DRAFT_664687 [Dactylonectria estremocensis]|uniref:Protein kinase domain-containing protein n=1 Tax=Dactylonectria estremocensis TaxID=1079267 RepID=A0A9P9EYH6_9HYPO|nr:hypothetical protein B0J13DRAFT_664687 [Dactylonectria estremocensis]
MDCFQTAVTSCQIIYSFLEASAAHSTQSKSLAMRFRYDARILQHFLEYSEKQQQLSDEDSRLLSDSAEYLGSLLQRLEVCKAKLENHDRWSKEINKVMWYFRRTEFIDLEKELFEWTRRLDLRLVALPPSVRSVISFCESDEDSTMHTPSVAAQKRIERFLLRAEEAKRRTWEGLLIHSHHVDVLLDSSMPNAQFKRAMFRGRPVIVEYKPYSASFIHDAPALDTLRKEIGEFAAALSYLDPSNTCILRCVGLFHEPEADQCHFALVHDMPPGTSEKPTTFKSLLLATDSRGKRLKLKSSLNSRLSFAKKLATAVFFLHAVGWVHKDIRSHNILVMERAEKGDDKGSGVPPSLGSPYLINFGMARSNEAHTDPERQGSEMFELDIYSHYERQPGHGFLRYTMAHDVYSLGVVLLELGLWWPLEEMRNKLEKLSAYERKDALLKLARGTEILMGRKYAQIVEWCLSLSGNDDAGNVKYAAEVLEKLEDLANAI